ncbi:MAG: hypothetical protein LH610_08975 [Sphingomonas bacterium]|nr:hypothetical protein [Sphingomonas bacterium]
MATSATISVDPPVQRHPTQLDLQAIIPLARPSDASDSWAVLEALAESALTGHIAGMIDRSQWKRWLAHPIVDWTILILGVILILLSPVVGAIPGPGGVFVLALGLAMVLRTSRWARRRYVEFKRWQPKAGRWTDWGMRRKSALRRAALVKEQKALGEDETSNAIGPAPATNPTGSQGSAGN